MQRVVGDARNRDGQVDGLAVRRRHEALKVVPFGAILYRTRKQLRRRGREAR